MHGGELVQGGMVLGSKADRSPSYGFKPESIHFSLKKTTTVLYDHLTLRTYESTAGGWISVCCLPHTAHQIAKKHSDSN